MTQLDGDINILDPCPPDEFLQAWATGNLKDKSLRSVIHTHLEFCTSCQQKVREFKRAVSPDDDPVAKRAQALRERQLAQQDALKQGPLPGTMWRTVPESEKDSFGPLVLVLHNQGTTVTVAEISEDIAQAIHTDMVLDPHESALRFHCMIRTENIFTTSPDRLTLFAGAVSPSLINKVWGFCKDAERFDENIPLSKFVFLKDSQGTELMRRQGITSGMLVTDESDPRLEFLELSKERCSYLTRKSATKTSSWPSARTILDLVKRVAVSISQSAKKQATMIGEWKALKTKIARIQAENAKLKRMAAELLELKDEAIQRLAEAENVLVPSRRFSSLKAEPTKPVDPQKGKEILQAAQAGDLTLLRELVTDTSSANFSAEEAGTEPLHLAALNDHLAVATFLLDKGARIDAQDKYGKTALILAATKGNRDMVELLLKRGASTMLSDTGGRTALYWALTNGHKEIAEILRSSVK
ncbi:MAG: ankyrin repeat domain-containing protein [Desulfomonilaceae bacterium]